MLLRAREDTNNYLKSTTRRKMVLLFQLPAINLSASRTRVSSCTVRNASRCHDLLRVVRNLYRDGCFTRKRFFLRGWLAAMSCMTF